MEIRKTFNQLDNIEILSIDNQKTSFPEHYHETFCISLIRSGTEVVKMRDNFIYSGPSTISITNPFEVHANPLFDKNQTVSFDTIYLSQELVDFYLDTQNISFHNKQLKNTILPVLFNSLSQHMLKEQQTEIEYALANFLIALQTTSHNSNIKRNTPTTNWIQILLFIEQNLTTKLSIDSLARVMNMDKFNFAKKFRQLYNMSPMNYVLMRKIFTAKQQIQANTNLTALAYEFDFSDQAHFSKTFKRFVGVSPKAYKKQIQQVFRVIK